MKTKLTYLLLLFSILCLSGNVNANSPTIYGVMRASTSWGATSKIGVYSFPATNPTSFTEVHLEAALTALTGTYHTDGKYYAITKTTGMPPIRYVLIPYTIGETWTRGTTKNLMGSPSIMASNPVDEKMYVITQSLAKNTILNTMDVSTGTCTKVADVPDACTMGINVRGDIFIVGVDGKLYKLNPTTNESELVGDTGLTPKTGEPQGVTFDPLAPDKMYWSGNLANDVKGLYEIDTRSGFAQLIVDYDTKEVINGTFIFPPSFVAGTPDIVKDLDLVFASPEALTGKIKFTVPEKTPDGVALTGTVNLSIQINDGTPLSVEGQIPGSVYESSDITFTNDYQKIKVTASNATGSGNTSSFSIWVGSDIPAGVKDLLLTKNDEGEALLTWTVPQGQHGGAFDLESLRYKIIRHIDNKKTVIEEAYSTTSFVDASAIDGEMGNYSYEVIPYVGTAFGPSVLSNALPFGAAYWIPFREEFSSRSNFNRWTINNISGETVVYDWGYDIAGGGQVGSLRKSTGEVSGEDCDSWFISPPIKLEKERSYKISYKLAEYVDGRVGKVEVTLGTSLDPEGHTNVIETHTVNGSYALTYETFIHLKTVEEDGIYYIGFHDISTSEGYQIYLDDVFIEHSDLPGPVTDLVILPAPQGQLKTLISFKTPTTTVEGSPLDLISTVEIYRNDAEEPFWVSEGEVAIGQEFNLSDDSPINGLNTYRIICVNPTGEGEAVERTLFVGIDVPAAVNNPVLLNQNGDAVISWSAPVEGANGGYIDMSSLKYKVVRNDNVVVTENLTSTTITDSSVPRDVQSYYYYKITPFTEAGDGSTALTKVIRFGDAYDAPFYESFAGAKFTQKTWMAFEMSGSTPGNWVAVQAATMPDATSQDNDGGFVSFTSIRSFPGDSLRMVSPAINISKLEAPRLSFWMYHVEGNGVNKDRMWIQVSNKNGEYESLTSEAIEVSSTSKQGWTLYEFSLDKYKGSDNITLGFIGVSDYGSNIHIDNISVVENYVYPSITSLAGTVDSESVVLTWDDPTPASGETLAPILGYNVYRNNQKINQEVVTSKTYTDLPEVSGVYKYTVKVVYDAKESNPSNVVELTITVTDISFVNDGVSVYSSNNHIIMKGLRNQQVFIYSTGGQVVYNSIVKDDEEQVFVDKGIYIVRIKEKAIKVIVR